MLNYIKGTITNLTPTQATIETLGLGFQCLISLFTSQSLQLNTITTLYTHLIFSDSKAFLYGFSTLREREVFTLLISVSGVGPATALLMLSSVSLENLQQAIRTSDARALTSIKGVGMKTAQRIILDLQDKMPECSGVKGAEKEVEVDSDTLVSAIKALTTLGISGASTRATLVRIISQNPQASLSDIIRLALKTLTQR